MGAQAAQPTLVFPVARTASARRDATPRMADAADTSAAETRSEPASAPAPAATFDLDVHQYESDERVARYVSLFSGTGRDTFAAQLARGTRYETMIRARLHAAGLPEDLYYIPLIESGYEPQAVSRVAAVGMWQIMPGTARELGLRMDWWIDERRDPVRATDAAVRNLRWLRAEFGSPFLAAAAYNGGPTRLSRGLAQLAAAESQRADSLRADSLRADALLRLDESHADSASGETVVDGAVETVGHPTVPADDDATAAAATASADARFFALSQAGYLRPETKNYVPQLIAALLVAHDTSRYGIVVHPQAAYEYDSVRVGPLTPLAAVAAAAGAGRDELLDLNPHVLRGVTPPGASTTIRVPLGRGADAARRLDELPDADRRAFRRVTTGKRELLADVARREGVPLRVLRGYNPRLETVARGKWKGRLVAGQALRVPTRAVIDYARDVGDATGAAPLAPLPRVAAAEDSVTRPKPSVKAKAEAKGKPAAHETAKSKSASTKAKPGAKAKPNAKSKVGAKTKPNAKAKPGAKAKAGTKRHTGSAG